MGPKLDLLQKKLEVERAEQAARQRPKETVRHLSEEERLARIRQMEMDAGMNDERRMKRVGEPRGAGGEGAADGDEVAGNGAGAAFLKSMRSEVYTSQAATMGDRLQQNKHYVQKGVDADSEGFLKR